jgi:hypothetical protein
MEHDPKAIDYWEPIIAVVVVMLILAPVVLIS